MEMTCQIAFMCLVGVYENLQGANTQNTMYLEKIKSNIESKNNPLTVFRLIIIFRIKFWRNTGSTGMLRFLLPHHLFTFANL